jgi:MscS family membrane protein|tara:strand:- start:659 stop:1744 length:1086 start_codon:yes stop_codon:yes gene_type:complete
MNEFIEIFLSVWNEGVFGVNLNNVSIGIVILFIFILFRSLFSKIVINRLKSIVKKSKTRIDDEILEAFSGPLRFVPIVIGVYISTQYIDLNQTLEIFSKNLNRSLITIQIFWFLYKLIDPLSFLIHKLGDVLTYDLIDWGVRILKFIIFVIGAAAVLEIWGIRVGPILAGLGLLSVAVALGAQDLFKNLISGILILLEKRFQNGDWIKVENVVEGMVEKIGFRSTLVRRFDSSPVMVPNFNFAENAVTNFSNMQNRRIHWTIGLEYRTTHEQLRNIRDQIESYIQNNGSFVKSSEQPLFVRIEKFSDSSIDLLIYCFVTTKVWGEWLSIKEELALEVKNIVEKNKAGFAFPSQSIYIEKNS